MEAAYFASSYLNAGSPQCACIFVVDAGLVPDHPVHGENIRQSKRGAAGDKT